MLILPIINPKRNYCNDIKLIKIQIHLSNTRSILFSDNSNPQKRMKKMPVFLTKLQYLKLENVFEKHRYVTKDHRGELAASLRISEKKIKKWFQARRYKDTTSQKRFLPRHANIQEPLIDTTSGMCILTNIISVCSIIVFTIDIYVELSSSKPYSRVRYTKAL